MKINRKSLIRHMSLKKNLQALGVFAFGLAIFLVLWVAPQEANCDEMIEFGIRSYLQGDLESAASHWSKAYNKNPNNPDASILTGNCLIIMGKNDFLANDFESSCKYLKKSREIFADNGNLKYLLLLTEFESLFQTGGDISSPDNIDSKNEKAVIFDLIFKKEEEKPVAKIEEKKEEVQYIIYITQLGETLATISKKYYKSYDKWMNIWKHNPHLSNPHRLFPGTRLVIPITK